MSALHGHVAPAVDLVAMGVLVASVGWLGTWLAATATAVCAWFPERLRRGSVRRVRVDGRDDVVRMVLLLAIGAVVAVLRGAQVRHGRLARARVSPRARAGAVPVGLGPTQHLAGHRRDLAGAEEQEAQEVA